MPWQRHARWLEEALYVMWRAGAEAVTWFKVVDEPRGSDYGATYQSGLYLLDGTPKPALTAFRFPFVTERAGTASVRAWGKAPGPGGVAIQRLRGGRWVTIRNVPVAAGGVFLVNLRLHGRAQLRALNGADASLTWTQR